MEMENSQTIILIKEYWEKLLNDVDIRKEDMNKLVMSFLVEHCCEDAVRSFIKESGTKYTDDRFFMQVRAGILRNILCGNINAAFTSILDLYSEISREHPLMIFQMGQQLMIEHIRKGEVGKALQYGQEFLAPLALTNPHLKEEVEKTCCLLAFEDPYNCPFGKLLDPSQPLETAKVVNQALLTREGQEKEVNLDSMLKELLLVQNELDERASFCPQMNISSGILQDPVI